MDINNISGYNLIGLDKINIILGKNGCGKSSLLRVIEDGRSNINNLGKISYIIPERSGFLTYDAGIENSMVSNPNNLRENRNRNQFPQFKQQTTAQFRKLRDLVLSEVEASYESGKTGTPVFNSYLADVNSLLDEIEIRRSDPTFKIFKKNSQSQLSPERISSGESELIALGIEILVFKKEIESGKTNILLLDEPDVHLHPDLQVRLMHFIKDQVDSTDFKIIISTHSTAILGSLENYSSISITFMKSGDKNLIFTPINDVYKKILPIFGAHPLSNIFNESPILLVEGEDDERIWQQSVRSSNGNIKIYPCACGSVTQIAEYERDVKTIIQSVYDTAKVYSLRDGDDNFDEIDDDLPIIKLKLKCYSAENLLLTDEVLESLSTDWEEIKDKIADWIDEKKTKQHPHYTTMNDFMSGGFDRKKFKIKDIRNDLMGIIGSEKPWEIAVGQVLSRLTKQVTTKYSDPGSIYNFLGEKIINNLF